MCKNINSIFKFPFNFSINIVEENLKMNITSRDLFLYVLGCASEPFILTVDNSGLK